MPIRVKCPGCGKEIKAPTKYRGRKISCPGCKEHLFVPESDAGDAAQEAPPNVTVSPTKPGAFPEINVSFDEKSKNQDMPLEPALEMQDVGYSAANGEESNPINEVHVTRIRVPIGDAIWLIITFWLATLVIAFVLFVGWLALLMLLAIASR